MEKHIDAYRVGVLTVDGQPGQHVRVVGETALRYRVMAIGEKIRLPLRGSGVRIVYRPGTVLVPKTVVRAE